ncbi:MAG TPA: YIP1 family protein [Flavobacterium sp.]|nr:YIP1 family protein [Flavobacterium sp.]
MNWKILFNPFEKYSEKTLLIFGIVATLLGSFLGYLMNARFDGIVDMHLVREVQFQTILIDNIINTLVLFILFFVFGKIINPKTRAIDMLNVSMICRIPMYLVVLGNIGGYLERATQSMLNGIDLDNLQNIPQFEMLDLFVILIFSVVSIGFLVWMIVLLWKGFKTATNTKRTRDIIIFIMLFILAEVLSKYLIGTFNF